MVLPDGEANRESRQAPTFAKVHAFDMLAIARDPGASARLVIDPRVKTKRGLDGQHQSVVVAIEVVGPRVVAANGLVIDRTTSRIEGRGVQSFEADGMIDRSDGNGGPVVEISVY